jgi:hypothetical protein
LPGRLSHSLDVPGIPVHSPQEIQKDGAEQERTVRDYGHVSIVTIFALHSLFCKKKTADDERDKLAVGCERQN